MHKIASFVNKKVDELGSRHATTSITNTLPTITKQSFPDESDIYKYRKQRGVNLGTFQILSAVIIRWDSEQVHGVRSLLDHWTTVAEENIVVLERWIADHPFRSAQHPASSDLDVARGDNAQQIFEEHWTNWIREEDWAWIVEQGINTVRIPVSLLL